MQIDADVSEFRITQRSEKWKDKTWLLASHELVQTHTQTHKHAHTLFSPLHTYTNPHTHSQGLSQKLSLQSKVTPMGVKGEKCLHISLVVLCVCI